MQMYHQLPLEKKSLSCDHHFHLMLLNRNSQSQRAAKMLYVLRYSFLLISICIRSMSWAATSVKVITASGHNITIECATDQIQDGVYMYKQEAASQRQEIFYFYKPSLITYKKMNKSKVSVTGALPNLTVTLLRVTTKDNGLYWCEFNLEEKTTLGKFTWLWIEEEKKECLQDALPLHLKIILILCAVAVAAMSLCIIGFFCVTQKMKGYSGKKKYKPSNVPSDSVYEEMKRSNLDAQQIVRTFINPDYQSSKQLR